MKKHLIALCGIFDKFEENAFYTIGNTAHGVTLQGHFDSKTVLKAKELGFKYKDDASNGYIEFVGVYNECQVTITLT